MPITVAASRIGWRTPAVAIGCGYRVAFRTDSAEGFELAVTTALAECGPVLIHARMRPGSLEKLGRPTIRPQEVARRFKAFLAG